MIHIKSENQIEQMKEACIITALAHEGVAKALKHGISTKELDEIAYEVISSNGATPSFKGQSPMFNWARPYPATACISINNQVIHGIPSNKVIVKEGDLVSIDLGAYKNGFHGDAARSYIVGKGSKLAHELVEVTKQSFFECLKYAKPGYRIGDVSNAVETYARSFGFSVVKEFQGHGVGRSLHEAPDIPNYGRQGTGPRLEPGMTLAIEPMINAGNCAVEILDDGWTVVTKDGSLSAHYENTILITKNEPEILTIMAR